MFKRKKTKLQIFLSSSTFITLLGFVVIALIFVPLVKNVKKQVSVNKEIDNLQKEILNLEKKNTELKGLITYLNSEEFTEEQARLNLNYKKEGEEVVVIKEKNSNLAMRDADMESVNSIYNIKGLEDKKQQEKEKNIKKWLKYFLN